MNMHVQNVKQEQPTMYLAVTSLTVHKIDITGYTSLTIESLTYPKVEKSGWANYSVFFHPRACIRKI